MKDRKGRERRPTQDAALNAINQERKHPEGVTAASHRIAMTEDAHARFKALTALERGQLIEACEQMRETLEFYANEFLNYQQHRFDDGTVESRVNRDGGAKARNALEALPPGGQEEL